MSLASAFLFVVFHFTSNVMLRSVCYATPQHRSVLEYLTSVPLTPLTEMCGRGRKICGRGRQNVCVRTSLAYGPCKVVLHESCNFLGVT